MATELQNEIDLMWTARDTHCLMVYRARSCSDLHAADMHLTHVIGKVLARCDNETTRQHCRMIYDAIATDHIDRAFLDRQTARTIAEWTE
uniref:Uncharacterized protein n=1 Tax=viral metagenome TaxID=1070528 RepID=A0A6M3JHN9_9ZZZZ